MTNLVADIGNSFTKLAVFNGDSLVWMEGYATISTEILNNVLNTYKPQKAIVSSVKKQTESWERYLGSQVNLIKFSTSMATSVKNHYQTPQTLGADRVAAVTGAHAKYPHTANLVIDAGTCITYDMIDKEGNYFGGSISPGLNMRYKALNYYTAALPVLTPDDSFVDAFGYDTDSSIRSGVQNGIRFEVLGFIESYFKALPSMNIILTGGDSIFFDTVLKNSIFAPHIKIEPHLVLIGLNAVIQQHND
jgi:type III pantothenate kinase